MKPQQDPGSLTLPTVACRDIVRWWGPLGTIHAVPDLREGFWQDLLRQPDRWLWSPDAEPVKIDRATVMVRLEVATDGGVVSMAYKRLRPRNAWKAICGLFRPGRARRSWRLGHALLARGIATPRPLVLCQPRRPWFWRESYLATEWLDGAENLHLWGWRLAAAGPTERLRWAGLAAASLGRLVGRMHAEGFSHRDLKGANVLVRQERDAVQTSLVDMGGVRVHRRLSRRRRAADLARLAVSLDAHRWVTAAVCWRFLREYAVEFPRGTIDLKGLWRQVARLAARRVQRKRRRGEEVL